MGERGLEAAGTVLPGLGRSPRCVGTSPKVYEHKVRVMADNAWPEAWPPGRASTVEEPVEFLPRPRTHLFEEFSEHDDRRADDDLRRRHRRSCSGPGGWRSRSRSTGSTASWPTTTLTPIPDDLATRRHRRDAARDAGRRLVGRAGARPSTPSMPPVAVEAGGRRWICDVRRGESVDDRRRCRRRRPAATVAGDARRCLLLAVGAARRRRRGVRGRRSGRRREFRTARESGE